MKLKAELQRRQYLVTLIAKVSFPVLTPDYGFKERVNTLVSQIPKGGVMTYGQIAILCGDPRAARVVGGIAHYGSPDIPWQRVVNKNGGLARGYPGGMRGHKEALKGDGVQVSQNYKVNLDQTLWTPDH